MSRTVIAAVVAVVIAALTAVAFFVASTSIDDKVRKDAEAQLRRAYQVIGTVTDLKAIDAQNKAERLAGDRAFVTSLKSESQLERGRQARLGFTKFTSDEKEGRAPDIIALVDAQGNIVAMNDVPSIIPKQWKKEGTNDTIIPALNVVLGNRVIISDMLDYQDRLMTIGVAPVIDPDAPVPASDPDGVVIIGAIVVAYAQTAQEAQNDKGLLGTEIAYYDGTRVFATSFTKSGATEEDTAKGKQLSDILKSGKVVQSSSQSVKVKIDGVDYFAAAIPMPRKTTSSKRMPKDYPPVTAGAMVLSPVIDVAGTGATIKIFIILLGAGALAISMLGLYLSHRRLIAQVDSIELGVTDIINGNVDRTFRPVGPELDGLANGLNVML
ncbi:MAG TPA: hypothetical protein VLT45_15935, partial [Kofleriaceae bacterium]|nr:hypothetical protein [Kofleriaceae bacterium]